MFNLDVYMLYYKMTSMLKEGFKCHNWGVLVC